MPRLAQIYGRLPIGNPLDDGTLIGPLIDRAAFDGMQAALAQAKAEGGTVHGGGRALADRFPDAFYVAPALVEMPAQSAIVRHETFAPIVYVLRYSDLDEAIAMHNAVPQGLASAIFTNDLREAERFMSAAGSDCGIVNVNIGPSGAEIGGAFGGEKRRAAAANPAATRGRATCGGPPTRSTTRPPCRWPKASASTSTDRARARPARARRAGRRA